MQNQRYRTPSNTRSLIGDSAPSFLFNVAALLMIIIVVLVNTQIILSNFGIRLGLLRELSRVLAVSLGFFAFPLITIQRNNIEVSYFYDKIPESKRRYVDTVTEFLVFAVIFAIFVSSILATIIFQGSRTSLAGLPVAMIYGPAVLATSVILLAFISEFLSEHPPSTVAKKIFH